MGRCASTGAGRAEGIVLMKRQGSEQRIACPTKVILELRFRLPRARRELQVVLGGAPRRGFEETNVSLDRPQEFGLFLLLVQECFKERRHVDDARSSSASAPVRRCPASP